MFRRPQRIIIPQYSAPKYLSLLAAAELLGDGRRAVAAQIVGLAVGRAMAITPLDSARGKKTGFTLTLKSLEGLSRDELDTMRALFPRGVVGETIDIRPGRNAALGRRLRTPRDLAATRLVASDLARERRFFERLSARDEQPVVPLPAAFPLIDHLWGVYDYIALAEKDRLAFLQSPAGAELRPDVSLNVQALVLNEKLLPYAVLFGLEKQWIRELGVQVERLSSDQLDDLADLGDVLVLLTAVDVESLFLLADLAGVIVGAGRVAGGVLLFFFRLFT